MIDVMSSIGYEFPDRSAEDAAIKATLRASARFGAFLNEATTEDEFENRWAHVKDSVENICVQAANESDSEVVPDVKLALMKRADLPPQEHTEPVAMPDIPSDVEQMMALHPDASPEDQQRLMQFYKMTPPGNQTLDQQVNQPNFYDMNEVDLANPGRMAASEDDDDKDKKGDPKNRPCPTCRAQVGEDCSGVNSNDKVGKGDEKYHETRKKGKGEPGRAVVKLMSEFKEFVASEDGDSYWKENVDLNSEKAGNGDPEPEPKMDTSEVPEGGLPPIEVPSERHPTEQQSVLDMPDYGMDVSEEGWNDSVTERIDPANGIGDEQTGESGGVFPNRNQAQPVNANTKTAFDPDYDRPRGWNQGPEYSLQGNELQQTKPSAASEAMRALTQLGVPQDKAMQLINQYMDESHSQMTQENTEDPYGMSQGLGPEDMRSMHTVGRTAQWRVL
jgi:hypothetical protein